MQLKNSTYTLYNGHEFQVTKLESGRIILYYRGENCPDSTFSKVNISNYEKEVNVSEISNIYSVTTHAKFKGFEFQVERIVNEDSFQLATGDYKVFEALKGDLKFIDRGYYLRITHKSEISEMWERRMSTPYLSLPMPHDMEEIKKIDFK